MKICTMVSLGMIGGGMLLAMICAAGRGWAAVPWGKVLSLAKPFGILDDNLTKDLTDNLLEGADESLADGILDGLSEGLADGLLDALPEDFAGLDDLEVILHGVDGAIPGGAEMPSQSLEDIWKSIGGTRKEYAMGSGIRKLDIDIGGYYVIFARSEEENFRVETINEKNFQCYVKGDTLYLQTSATRFPTDFQAGLPKRAVRLYVPFGAHFADVDIALGAGAMGVEGLAADEASVDVGAGTVWGQGMRVGSLTVSVGAGMVRLVDAKVDELSLEVGAGSLEFGGSIEKEVSADCGMGSVGLTLAGREEDFDYKLECAMGSLIIGSQDYSGFARERTISHGAAKEMDLHCAMGNIEVLFQN